MASNLMGMASNLLALGNKERTKSVAHPTFLLPQLTPRAPGMGAKSWRDLATEQAKGLKAAGPTALHLFLFVLSLDLTSIKCTKKIKSTPGPQLLDCHLLCLHIASPWREGPVHVFFFQSLHLLLVTRS